MSKTLVVFGATGQQGSSVINSVLNDAELSQMYQIRALSRDLESDKAKQLRAKKVEVVQADAQDRPSIEAALTGAHVVFAMTNPSFTADGFEVEFQQAKTIADVAVAKGLEYIIFSTLPSVSEISGGKYTKVTPFDAKAAAETYMRSLPTIKSAFVCPGGFMENFHNVPFLGPQKQADGTYVVTRPNHPHATLPLINTTADTGKFVGAILADLDTFAGARFCASTALYNMEEQCTILSQATDKKVVYQQLAPEQFRASLPMGGETFMQSLMFPEEFGYYGPDTKNLVEWAVAYARGKPNTLEDYLRANPLHLD